MDIDSIALKTIQPFPNSTRRNLVEAMAGFMPPANWRDDDLFYQWLIDHYDCHGTRHVDAVLEALGGKDARRTLRFCWRAWAQRQNYRSYRLDELCDHHSWHHPNEPNTRILHWLNKVLHWRAEDAEIDDGNPAVSDFLAEQRLDAAIERTRQWLMRAEALGDDGLVAVIDRFNAELAGEIEQIERARESEGAIERLNDARDAFSAAWSALPAALQSQLDYVYDGQFAVTQTDDLQDAAVCLGHLLAAADEDHSATQKLQQPHLPIAEKKALLLKSQEAMLRLERACERAIEALASLVAGTEDPMTNESDPDVPASDVLILDVPADSASDVLAPNIADSMLKRAVDCAQSAVPNEPVPIDAFKMNQADEPPADFQTLLPPEDDERLDWTADGECNEDSGGQPSLGWENSADVQMGMPEQTVEPEITGIAGTAGALPLLDRSTSEAASDGWEGSEDWDRWVQMCLHSERIGLAAHLARGRELAAMGVPRSWPSCLLMGLVFGRGIKAGNDRAAARYEELSVELATCTEQLAMDTGAGLGQALAVIAGAMRPCLVANYAGVTVIEALETGRQLAEFHDLLEFLRDGPRLGLAAISEMAPPAEDNQRLAQRTSAVVELKNWFESVQSRTTPYQPANALWQRVLIKPDGIIGSVYLAVIEGRPEAIEMAEMLVEELRSDPGEFLDTHFERYMTGKGRGLEGMARARFLTWLQEASDHLDTWMRSARPPVSGADRFARHRMEFKAALGKARRATIELAAEGDVDVRTGAVLLDTELQQFEDIINGTGIDCADPHTLLDSEIALLADFPLNGRRDFQVTEDDVVALRNAAENALAVGVPSWDQALEAALAAGAPGVAQRIARWRGPISEELQARIDAETVKQRKTLEGKRQKLRMLLDDLLSATVGDSSTKFESRLQGLEAFNLGELPCDRLDEPEAIGDFPALDERLEIFSRQLNAEREELARKLEQRIDAQQGEGCDLSDCWAMLAKGSLGTLAEELVQIERYGPDQRAADAQSLLEPVAYFANTILTQQPDCAEVQIQNLRDAAYQGRAQGTFRFDLLHESERREAKGLLECWIRLKQATLGQPGNRSAALVEFMSALGFSNVKVSQDQPWREGRRIDIKVDPLRSAGDCILPSFGSQANGAYTVLLMPKSKLEKSVQSGFSELQPPVIALAMEWMTPKARLQFLRKARGNPAAAFALLDEPAAAALAATPNRNLRAFFSLAVPFGAAKPYSDTGAATSIEMFFGREREYVTLVDPQGSCLVYGGRQLGKTALLKQIELRNHSNSDFIVAYRDIKNVGSVDLPGSVWDRIGEALREKKMASADACRAERVIDTIKSWLAAQPQRRLLVLLDEADNFLEAEMEAEFPNIMKMKGLMEETGRRAKFVYAGLHNVQRFVRAPNSPMLHLGEPVNIGPLLGHDRHAARQMVFEPMAAVGIGFQQPTDAHHMLSLVGYYPSLLQTFGKSLLASVDEGLGRNAGAEDIPKLLDRDRIDQAFKASEFRRELRDKFRATLELDPRYELIAYSVCYKSEEERLRGRITGQGFGIREIFELAQEYWPQGFSDIRSSDAFGAILDEMVGLGVLSKQSERYAIRSARIAAMLGDADQITTHLLEFSDRPRPVKPDPLANHRELPGSGHSPLTWRSEKALVDQLRAETHPTSVVFIAGTPAVASIENMVASLKSLAEFQNWPPPRELTYRSVDDLHRVIQSSRKEASTGRPKLILCRDQWPDLAEASQIDKLKELRETAQPVRLVFLGSGQEQIKARDQVQAFRLVKAAFLDLTPWDREAVNLWLIRHARQGAEDPENAVRVLEATGGFATVFERANVPRAGNVSLDDLLARLLASAEQNLSWKSLGLEDPKLLALVRKLAEFDSEEGLPSGDLSYLAAESGSDIAGTAALQAMGLLVQVQISGSPQWRLLGKIRAMVDTLPNA